MNRYHDHSNSYKGKHLIGAGLQFQRFNLTCQFELSSGQRAWPDVERYGDGEVAESSGFGCAGSRDTGPELGF